MSKIYRITFQLALSGLLCWLAACTPGLNQNLPFAAPDRFKVEALKQGTAVQTHNQLARAYLKQQQAQVTTIPNQIFSPLSLSLALQMVSNGTAGTTLAEIQKVLKLPEGSLDGLNQDNEILLKSLVTAEDQALLRIASSFWLDPIRPSLLDPKGNFEVNFLPGFQDILKERYLAKAQVVDFDKPEATKIINDWVKQATNEKIQQMISDTSDPTLIAILMNAIYFKANWKYQFKKENTRPMPFMSTAQKTIQAQTMFLEAPFKASLPNRQEPYQVVELPYGQSDRLVMDIFLPTPQSSLNDMLEDLSAKDASSWFEGLEPQARELLLYLPRFKFEQTSSLKNWLNGLGLKEIFDKNQADLSAMLRSPADKERKIGLAYVSDVFQKALIEVNEEGTEAAAVSVVEISCSGACPTSVAPGPEVIRVDRSFLAVLRDRLTGTILFTSVITEPEVSP